MAYIDWEYYDSLFPDKLSTDDFEKLLPQAELKIEVMTHMRCQGVSGYKLERVKAAVANLVTTMCEQDQTRDRKGIASVSNAGYSESYLNVTAEQDEAELEKVCCKWLSGTGLMGAL